MLVRIIIGLFAISSSAGALGAPCVGFVDVDDSNATYCSAVTYVKNKGITLGCTDAIHYCPNDNVSRLQVALFLERAGKGNAANTLVDSTATIGGGGASGTQLSLPSVTVECTFPSGGPCANRVTDVFGTVAGGVGNQAGDASGVIDSAPFATVGGGRGNTASGIQSTVAGGFGNIASGFSSTVAGGGGNGASGSFSAVIGGQNNVAGGDWSVALGRSANAGAQGCFVFSDAVSTSPTNCSSNTFVARATGGVTFITSGTSPSNYNGLYVPAGGGAWVVFSDSNYKENLAAVSARDVLERVVNLPLSTWNWKTQPASVRHMGPTAQDFYAAFGLGDSDKGISTVDPDGVALAAIQGLYLELKSRDATIAKQRSLIAQDESRIADEERAIADQERRIDEAQHEIAALHERLTAVESLRGELAALRNAIAAATSGANIAAQGNSR